MRVVWNAALKDLRRQLADPFGFALWLGMPIAIGGLIVLAFGGRDVVPKARLLVADEDRSFVSELVAGALARVPVLDVEPATSEAGRARVERGRASALLVVPAGFGASILRGDSTTWSLVVNPAERILPAIARETVEVLGDALHYLRRAMAPALADLPPDVLAGRRAPPPEFLAAATARLDEVYETLAPHLAGPTLRLRAPESARPPDEPRGGVGALFFPGILLMALLFASQGMSADLWEEAEGGTLRRAAATPGGVAALFAGKLLAGTILMAVVCLAAAVIGVRFFAVPAGVLPLVALWGTLAGASFLCGMLLLQTLASARRTANMLITFVLFPLLMVGGSFFPLESLPPWLAAIGRWTPNGRAVVELQAMIRGGLDPGALALDALAFAAVAAAALALAIARARRRFVAA